MKETSLLTIIEVLDALAKITNGRLVEAICWLKDAQTIWERSPFKMGDKVKLNKTPEISEKKSWGWLGAKHFLIEGATATICDRQFYDGRFIFGCQFDNETYMDYHKAEHLPDRKSIYMFSENWLSMVSSKSSVESNYIIYPDMIEHL